MRPWGEPEWPGALWIGECDRADADGTDPLRLDGADADHSARDLVRDGRTLLGVPAHETRSGRPVSRPVTS